MADEGFADVVDAGTVQAEDVGLRAGAGRKGSVGGSRKRRESVQALCMV